MLKLVHPIEKLRTLWRRDGRNQIFVCFPHEKISSLTSYEQSSLSFPAVQVPVKRTYLTVYSTEAVEVLGCDMF
jgi:hypothetical protein